LEKEIFFQTIDLLQTYSANSGILFIIVIEIIREFGTNHDTNDKISMYIVIVKNNIIIEEFDPI